MSIDIREVAAIEILIQAMDVQSTKWPAEVSTTRTMLRKYIETHSSNYFSLAREAFSEIDRDIRLNIKTVATRLAETSNADDDDAGTASREPATIPQVHTKPNYGWMLRERT